MTFNIALHVLPDQFVKQHWKWRKSRWSNGKRPANQPQWIWSGNTLAAICVEPVMVNELRLDRENAWLHAIKVDATWLRISFSFDWSKTSRNNETETFTLIPITRWLRLLYCARNFCFFCLISTCVFNVFTAKTRLSNIDLGSSFVWFEAVKKFRRNLMRFELRPRWVRRPINCLVFT